MERVPRQEQASWPLNEANDVFYKYTPRPKRRAPCRRHVASLHSSCTGPLRKGEAEEGFRLQDCEDGRVSQLSTRRDGNEAETSRRAKSKPNTCEGPEGEIPRTHSGKKFTSCTAKLRSSDFESPRELTCSSDKFTTASGSRLLHGGREDAEIGVTSIYYQETGNSSIQDAHKNDLDPKFARRFTGEALSRGAETARRGASANSIPCRCPRKKNNYHSQSLAPGTANSTSPKRCLFVRRTERDRSTSTGIPGTRDDKTPIRAPENLSRHQPCNMAQRCQHDQILRVTCSTGRALLARGGQSVDVTVRSDGSAVDCEEQACPTRSPRRCEAESSIRRNPTVSNRHQTILRGTEAFEGPSGTSEYPPSSMDEETQSDTCPDGLSWIDYPVKGCQPDSAQTTRRPKQSAYCHSVRDIALSTNTRRLLTQAKQGPCRLGETYCLKEEDRDESHDKLSCLPHRYIRREEEAGPREELGFLAHDEIGAPVACFCESKYTVPMGTTNAPSVEGLTDPEQRDEGRDGSRNASRWKARLKFTKSHPPRDECGCEHEICTTSRCRGLQNKMSQTLRQKMGDAVSRLRRKRALAFVKQQRHETWPWRISRETSSTSHSKKVCAKKTRAVWTADEHSDRRTPACEQLLSDTQDLAKYKSPWVEGGNVDDEAAIQSRKCLCEECAPVLRGRRFPNVACSATGADRVETLARLPDDDLSSAVVEKPAKVNNEATSGRIQPLALSCAGEREDSDTGNAQTGPQPICSVVKEKRSLMREHRFSAGTTHTRTSSVGSEKRSENCPRSEGVQSHRQKTPASAQRTVQAHSNKTEALADELRKSSYDSVTAEAEAGGGHLSRGLSDLMTQASSEYPHNCAVVGKDKSALNEHAHARHDPSQIGRLLSLEHNTRRALVPSISRSQSADSARVKRGGFQNFWGQKLHDANTAITSSDIEASIDWIIEAGSNPKLLRAARELLMRRAEAERAATRICCHCGAGNLPAHYADWNPCSYPSTASSRIFNTISSKLPSRTMSLDESVYGGTSSSCSSFYYQRFRGRGMKATKKESHIGVDRGLSSISSYNMGDAHVYRSRRRTYEEDTMRRSCSSEFDFHFRLQSPQKVNGRRRCPLTYEEDHIRKVSLCYAPSDVAWNTDQLI